MNFDYVLVYGNRCDNFNTGYFLLKSLQGFKSNTSSIKKLIHKGNNSVTVYYVYIQKYINIYGLLCIKHEAERVK